MPTDLMMAYETLETDDKKLVEQLIYSLFKKVKKNTYKNKDTKSKEKQISDLESLKGILVNCKYTTIDEARIDRLSEKYGV